MRIIGSGDSQHDYYDCIQRMDEDRSVIYSRKPFTVEHKATRDKLVYWNYKGLPSLKNKYSPLEPNFYWGVVGFCDKIYPYIVTHNLSSFLKDGISFHYTIDSFLKHFAPLKNYEEWYSSNEDRIEEFYKSEQKKEVGVLFEKSPIFLFDPFYSRVYDDIYGRKFTLQYNCCLKELQFMKVKDTQNAYQELVMWHNKRANPEKPIPQMDDATKIHSHGFDKFSFRKEKQHGKK